MSVTAIILLILLGIILLLIEFLIVPGVTIAGIAGSLMIVGGVFCGYYFHDSQTGSLILGGSVVAIVAIFILAFKTKTWQKLGLDTSIDSHVSQVDDQDLNIGDPGKTISRLAPIGKALINNHIYEVRSNGKYIDPNEEVEIIRIDGNKIFVKLKN